MKRDKKRYHVLVIEDNPGDIVIVEDFLAEQILLPEITCAGDFSSASVILSAGNVFDVILLDLTLPDKNGQELVNGILQIAGPCPVIILTGYADIEFSVRSISQGILDYLLKEELTSVNLYKSIVYAIERKKITASLIQSEKRYSDLFRLSPQPMWVFDPETLQFVQVNKAAIDLYGYSEEEFMNMRLTDIKPVEDEFDEAGLNNMKRTDTGVFKNLFRHLKKCREIIQVEIFSTPIIINDKILRSVIAIDVTEKNLYQHKITKAIIKTQEDERYEIGGELHDNVCQLLAVSQFSLAMLKKQLPVPSVVYYDQCKENICLALDEIRNLSHRLAPAFFGDSKLEDAFRKLLDSFNLENQYDISLYFDDAVKKYPLTLELQLNLYRIMQEQLKNIAKYAKATLITVEVIILNNKLKMRIGDDGVGFDANTVKGGIGMANMKRRAELFSGVFTVDVLPGNGCDILIEIPLDIQNTHDV
jgi:PAS domain S-box-containing protein